MKTRRLPFSIESEEKLVEWLDGQGLQLANINTVSPALFYKITLRRFGCIVKFTPKFSFDDKCHRQAHVVRFETNMAIPFPACGLAKGQLVLVEPAPTY